MAKTERGAYVISTMVCDHMTILIADGPIGSQVNTLNPNKRIRRLILEGADFWLQPAWSSQSPW